MAVDPYEDIPGTIVFDGAKAREGYCLNMFCFSLMQAENRAAFKADETAYLDRFSISTAQRQAVLQRDWNGLLGLGANIYYLAKLGATDGRSFQFLAAAMSGMSQEDYAQMMRDGGRSIEGNRGPKGKSGG